MAVTFVIGNAHRLSPSLFAPGTSIASTLANEFGEAEAGAHLSSLFALGLALFIITFIKYNKEFNCYFKNFIIGCSIINHCFKNSQTDQLNYLK